MRVQPDIDLEHFVSQLDGDPEAVQAVGQAIREDLARRLAEMKQAGQCRDTSCVQHHAHALKLSLSILAAREAERQVASLVHSSDRDDWTGYRRTFEAFECEIRFVDQAMAQLLLEWERSVSSDDALSVSPLRRSL